MQQNIRDIRIEDFNYPLPDARIAKHPLVKRDNSKLLCYRNKSISEYHFYDLPELLPDKAMLIYNNTRVINARLRFRKPNNGAVIEIFCLEPVSPHDYSLIFQTTTECTWLCFVGNAKRWKDNSISQTIEMDGKEICLTANRRGKNGNAFEITFSWDNKDITFASILEVTGEIPIPPYLNRGTEDTDKKDYQTVYSHVEGSVAAPTAGLHFTSDVLGNIDRKGIKRRELTLHVGAGTFQPVKSDTIGEHEMHTEFISVPKSLLTDLIEHESPVIAVGTTSVRTLESLYYIGAVLHDNPKASAEDLQITQWQPYNNNYTATPKEALTAIVRYLDNNGLQSFIGSTQIMIAPGYRFHIIDGMVTNFHQPQSTLLLLVSAFVDGNWKEIYNYALGHDFRFLSYGDSSLLLR